MQAIKRIFWIYLLLLAGLWWFADRTDWSSLSGLFGWRDADVWFCGPAGFGQALKRDLIALGLPGARSTRSCLRCVDAILRFLWQIRVYRHRRRA